jgi:hypothetical protein
VFGNFTAMRTILAILFLATLCRAVPADAATNEVLVASEYEPAEVVYKQFLWPPALPRDGWRTNVVFCLVYGRSNSPLPADFMARFADIPLRVITDTNALLFAAGGSISERASGRPAVVLALRALSIKGDSAGASIRWIDSARTIAHVYRLVNEGGRWTYQSASSTSLSSRWSP